jgi:predicted metal-dependent peptidase
MKPNKITVVQFDTELKSVDEVKSIEELLKIKFTGRGGTLIKPVIDHINATKPQLALILSDGGFHFYDGVETKHQLIWVIYNSPAWVAPYGKVIHYSI